MNHAAEGGSVPRASFYTQATCHGCYPDRRPIVREASHVSTSVRR
jgi:hypothetical protein